MEQRYRRELLLNRLEEIGRSLERTGRGLALIALGSVGLELERLDEFSDLDFFAIVEPGSKESFLGDLAWLSSIRPIAFCFRNTDDGYKLLFDDGVFCEFAVFVPAELGAIPFAPGRVLWKRPEVDGTIGVPVRALPRPEPRPVEWLVGEALTNLYVGLCRWRRGEHLSGSRFIQQLAVDRVLELVPLLEAAAGGAVDAFSGERRFEQRYPFAARRLSGFIQGYDRSPQSAAAVLDFLEEHFEVNGAMARAIRALMRAQH